MFTLALFCLFLVSCSNNDKPPYEDYDKDGYTVSVKFDANGGYFKNAGNLYLTDTYHFSSLPQNSQGQKEVYVVDPNSENRQKQDRYDIRETVMRGYFFAGWYAEKTPVLDENDVQKMDDLGNPLYQYSGCWDFSKPLLIDATPETAYTSENPVLTLHAAWVRVPSVEIYETINGEEIKIAEYEIGSADTAGQNLIKLPEIKFKKDGTHEFDFGTLKDAKAYVYLTNEETAESTDPQGEIGKKYPWEDRERVVIIDDQTNAVYTMFFNGFSLDESRAEILSGTVEHPYKYDVQTATISNPVMKLYVDFETKEGEWHKIYSAEEFCNEDNVLGRDFKYTNANLEIMSDLVFTDLKWPTITSFDGKIIGNGHKIIDARVVNTSGTKAALFREIGKDAVIKDITFENASVTVTKPSAKGGARYALFATSIESGFAFENVSIVNSKILISAKTEINSNILNGDYEVALLCAEGYHDGLNIDISGISFEPYVSESDLFELSATLDADGNKLILVFTVKEQDGE